MPGKSPGNRKTPVSLVTVSRDPPMRAWEVIETVAPGRTAPDSSRTVPKRVPVVTWADDASGTKIANVKARTVRDRLRFMLTSLVELGFLKLTVRSVGFP